MPIKAAPTLDYSSAPPTRRRWGRLAAVLLLVACNFPIYSYRYELLFHAQLFYWQFRASNYALPPDHVVYDMNGGVMTAERTPFEEKPAFYLPNQRPSYHMVQGGSTIFLHKMKRPDGTARLIELSICADWISHGPWDEESLFSAREVLTNRRVAVDTTHFPKVWDQNHWKFFAGQPDPNNPSHFTFDYDLDGNRHTCDAWLDNNGKLVISQRP